MNLPIEIMANVITFLSPGELVKCTLVSSLWNEVANSSYVWDIMCDRLWFDKVYVPAEFKQAKKDGASKSAYWNSIKDAKRLNIRPEELSEFVWNFRFKESAGEHWLAHDPWWRDNRPARVQFLADGRTVSLDGWPSSVEDSSSGKTMERKWRFIQTAAGRRGPLGSFLQINNFPPLIVSRYKNWGFLLQSCWVFYTSFPMPPQGACLELEDAALDITTETMKQEAMRYNIGVEFNLQDHGQILDLLQLLAQIHQQPNHHNAFGVFLGDDDMDDDEDNANEDANDDANNANDDANDYGSDGDMEDDGLNGGDEENLPDDLD